MTAANPVTDYWGRYDSSVEIAHTYAPDLTVPFTGEYREEGGVQLPVFESPPTLQLLERIRAKSVSAYPIILCLVDDIGKTAQESIMTELSVSDAADPDDIFLESEFIGVAAELVERIRGLPELPAGYRLSEDKRRLIFGSGKLRTRVPLVGFKGIDDPEHPSCPALDAAWTYCRLTSVAPYGANILPIGFSGQQRQAAAIARLLPELQGCQFRTYFLDQHYLYRDELDWRLDEDMTLPRSTTYLHR